MAEHKSSIIFELKNRIGGPMRRMRRQIQGETEKIGRSFAALSRRVGALGAGIAAVGAAAGAAVINLSHQFATSVYQTDLWAKRLGMTVGELSRLIRIGDRFGVQSEALIDALKELSMRTDEFVVTARGPAAEAFKRLGLSQAELNAVSDDTVALFDLVLSRLREVDDFAARQRLVDEIFGGQGGEQLAQMVSASAQELERIGQTAERMGAVFKRSDVRTVRDYIGALRRLRETLTGIQRIVSLELLPVFADLMREFREFLTKHKDEIKAFAREFGEKLPERIKSFVNAVQSAASAVQSFVDLIGGWKNALIGVGVAVGVTVLAPFLSLAGALWGIATKAGPAAFRMLTKLAGATTALNAASGAGGKIGGAGRLLRRGGLVGLAGAAGYGVGTLINNKLIESTDVGNAIGDAIGSAVAHTLAFFGVDEAQQAVANMERAAQTMEQAATRMERAESTVNVKIDSEGRARVTGLQSSGPLDVDVDAGPLMAGSG